MDAQSTVPNNLPRQPTSFVGRERDLEMIQRLFATTSLLTLTGAGGSGKTRLALQAAGTQLQGYPDGVWVVDLAPVSHPALLPHTVAAAAGIHEQPGRPLLETLVEALRPRRTLLILDNCEHLVAACAQLTDRLLRRCLYLRVLATSRETLGLTGEAMWPVPPLALPGVDSAASPRDLGGVEAVRLFVDRATAVRPDFRLTDRNAAAVVQICRRLDGMPLAIELAAARVAMLPPAQIVERLANRFRLLTKGSRAATPRHRTLRAAIDWSYDLLSEPEQRLLRRLSVFAGGWTVEAATAVCADGGLDADAVFDLLGQLTDKSLVTAETHDAEGRYRFLETVRQYCQAKLREAAEDHTVPARYWDWCLALAHRAEPALWGPEQGTWLGRLEREHDNIRAGLTWGKAAHDADTWLRLAGALWRFWWVRGHWTEGRGWLEAGRSDPDVSPAVRATALVGAAFLAWRQSDYEAATPLAEQSLALCRTRADVRGIVLSLHALGATAHYQGAYSRVVALGEESLAVARASNDAVLQGLSFQLLAMGREHDGARAVPLWEESIALFRTAGHHLEVASSLMYLAHVVSESGEGARAVCLYEESLSLFRDLGDTRATALALCGLGELAIRRADYDRAEDLARDGLTVGGKIGDRQLVALAQDILGDAAMCRGDYARATALYTASLHYGRAVGARPYICASLERLARVQCAAGRPDRAARLLGAAESLREAMGTHGSQGNRAGHRVMTAVHAALGDDDFNAARAEGRAMSLGDAIEYALASAEGDSLKRRTMEKPWAAGPPARLTRREREVTRLLARGLTNREIALELRVTERTAEAHVQNILNKLNVGSRTQVAIWVVQHGLQ